MLTGWEKRKTVARMQAYIETHLDSAITLNDLARVAGYSVYHAAHVFKEMTGRSPFDYVRWRRLSMAAERLVAGNPRVIDVAFDFVFDTHEGFTRAFTRQFGVPPSRFRASGLGFSQQPRPVTDDYRARQTGEPIMAENSHNQVLQPVFVQIVERPARKLIYRPGRAATHYFAYCEEVGCEIWDVLSQVKEALHEPMGLWLPDVLRPEDCSTYVQGVEVSVDYAGPVPANCKVMDLAACRMLVFQGPPYDDALFESEIGKIWDVMNGYDPASIGYAWADETGPRFQLAPMGYRGYIEGRPVRALNPVFG